MAFNGIDISQYQSSFDTTVDFVIIRLGYSVSEDPLAAQHTTTAKNKGIPYGGYWALYEGHSGHDQAVACYNLMQKYGVYRIAVDAEQFPGAATLTLQTVQDFIKTMQALNGDCGIYSGYWIKAHGGGTAGADWGWLADYTAFDRPSGWSTAFTLLWQYTSSNGTLDKDHFYGADLSWFAGGDEMAFADYRDGVDAAQTKAVNVNFGDIGAADTAKPKDFQAGWNDVRWQVNRLKGRDGKDGKDGADGAPGVAGPAGPAGPQGPKGDRAVIAVGTHLEVTA